MRREFKKVYNPETGRTELQHWTGGEFVKSLQQVSPIIAKGSITGKGYKKTKSHLTSVVKDETKEAVDQGKMIIDGLRSRGGFGIKTTVNNDLNDIQTRIRNLMKGSGLQTN